MRIQETQTGLLVQTPAKINLSLRVLGRRPDGYHELETLFASIGLEDTLLVEASTSPEISLQIHTASKSLQHLSLATDSSNLIVRAAEMLRQATGENRGARITLWKRIPVEAGMGGGSSDAAATLVALNTLWGRLLGHNELHSIAARLGSDVNFFLDSIHSGVGHGRGESIQAVPLHQPLHLVLIKPVSGLSTKLVFEKLNAPLLSTASHSTNNARTTLPIVDGKLNCEAVQNDLEPVARQLNSEVNRVLDVFSREQVLASAMTGSGTACFALCHTQRQAVTLAARLRGQGLGAVYVTQLGT